MANIKVTESVFNAVKTLLKGGATGTECAKYMKISTPTVTMIRRSETYEEYMNNRYAWTERKEKKSVGKQTNVAQQATQTNVAQQATAESDAHIAESKQTIVVQASHYMLEEQKKTNELLTSISNKLAFIVEELVGVKTGT